jgi:hypothetical protein
MGLTVSLATMLQVQRIDVLLPGHVLQTQKSVRFQKLNRGSSPIFRA